MIDNFTFEEWMALFERFRAESADDKEAYEKLGDYIRKVLFGCDWLDRRWISHKRCEEINNMMIPCPWGGYKDVYKSCYIMDEKGSQYYSSEDENIILGFAFMPKHDDIGRAGYNDTYFLVKGNKWYLFNLIFSHKETEKLGDIIVEFCPPRKGNIQIFYSRYVVEIVPNKKIDFSNDKESILKIIKDYVMFSNNYYSRNVIKDPTVIYKGKEVK